MTPRQREAVEAVRAHGSISAAARALGISRGTVQDLIRNSGLTPEERGQMLQGRARTNARAADPAVDEAMAAINTGLVPSTVWVKTKATETEPAYSVMLRPAAETAEDVAERIRAALEGMKPAEPVAPPQSVMDDLCAVYPVMDMHLGMHAWARETGRQDYDLKLAAQDVRDAQAKVMALTPPAKQSILLLGGDTLHANDGQAETPKSKHRLDVDGRHMKVLETAITIIGEMTERLAMRHESVRVRALRGNHDPESHLILTFALAERYRNDPRIVIEKDPRDLFMYRWGRCGIFANHGDRAKFQQIFNLLASICPFWSETPHRHYLSGHWHRERIEEIGGMRCETVRPFCPADAYGAMFPGGRVMQSLTFHKQDGLVLRALDPIERAA